mmetsp:Transcript_76421/g.224212  ORF Transcript_76421/g.224212 Transcript_76421/m.224212 type:complete len:444 (+) Transcript_76421:73-1404(+)
MVVPLLKGLSGLSNASASSERRRANSLTNGLRSAKDNAIRIAQDKSARGSLVLTTWRAKAQDFAAAAAAVAATSNRKSSAFREVEDEQKVDELCSMGFSDAAARLALRRSGNYTAMACHWLLEEQNRREIRAAEAKGAQAQEASACAACSSKPTQSFPSPEEYLELEAKADLAEDDNGAGLGMGTGQQCGTLPKDDTGAGLGMGAGQKCGTLPKDVGAGHRGSGPGSAACQASPRCRPALEAAEAEQGEGLGWSSPRPASSTGGASGFTSRASTARSAVSGTGPRPAPSRPQAWTPRFTPRPAEGGVLGSPAPPCRGCATEPRPARCSNFPDVQSNASGAASDSEDEAEGNGDNASEFRSSVPQTDDTSLAGAANPVDDSEFEVPLPPASASWDWPLSRPEKKERLFMLERNLQMMDRKILLRELVQLRVSQRHLAHRSMGCQ